MPLFALVSPHQLAAAKRELLKKHIPVLDVGGHQCRTKLPSVALGPLLFFFLKERVFPHERGPLNLWDRSVREEWRGGDLEAAESDRFFFFFLSPNAHLVKRVRVQPRWGVSGEEENPPDLLEVCLLVGEKEACCSGHRVIS